MGIDVLDESVFHKFNYQNKEAGTKLFFKHDAQCYYEFTPSTTTKVLKVFFAPKWDKHKNTIYTFVECTPGSLVTIKSDDYGFTIKARQRDLLVIENSQQLQNLQERFHLHSTSSVRSNTMANSGEGYQFTALGLSGSGKTTFMAGMYYKMTAGVDGYTIKADDDDSVTLTAYYERLADAKRGVDRFKSGTNQNSEYTFELQYSYKTLEKFRWIDYAGGLLKGKNSEDAEQYQELKNDIAKSEVLYIFVDGGLFNEDEEVAEAETDQEKMEIIVDIVQDSCARQVNHFISEYTAEREKLPPIVIIVTKYDLACQALGKASNSENMELLNKVIQKAFNPLFPDPTVYTGDDRHTSMVGIVPVSLGKKISENGYTGKLRPINMHMPAYIGIWFMMKSANNGQDSAIKKLSDAIEDSGIQFWLDGRTGKFSTLAEGYLNQVKRS